VAQGGPKLCPRGANMIRLRHGPMNCPPGVAQAESFCVLLRINEWRVTESSSPARGKEAPSRPWRPAFFFLLALVLGLTAACGGGGETSASPTPTAQATVTPQTTVAPQTSPPASPRPQVTATAGTWAPFRQVLERFVPESTAFKAYIPRITDIDRPNVDLTISPSFVSGRLHIIQFSGRGETFFGSYKGFELFKLEETPWAKLADGQPPLWAGAPGEEALYGYLDFFASGEPALANDRFWNAFAYAEAFVGGALGGDPALLQIDFDDAWDRGGLRAGGMRIEASQGNRHAYLGVLYATTDSGLDATTLVERLGGDFRQDFAVPADSTDEWESREWGYPNHIWFVQWESAS